MVCVAHTVSLLLVGLEPADGFAIHDNALEEAAHAVADPGTLLPPLLLVSCVVCVLVTTIIRCACFPVDLAIAVAVTAAVDIIASETVFLVFANKSLVLAQHQHTKEHHKVSQLSLRARAHNGWPCWAVDEDA